MELSYLVTILSSAAVGSVISVFGGVLASVFTNRGNQKILNISLNNEEGKRISSMIQNKGEELYCLIDSWGGLLRSNYLSRLHWIRGVFDYDHVLNMDIQKLDMKAKNLGYERILMLVDIYFLNLKPDYNNVVEHRNALNKMEQECLSLYKAGKDISEQASSFESKLLELDRGIINLQARLADSVSKVVSPQKI